MTSEFTFTMSMNEKIDHILGMLKDQQSQTADSKPPTQEELDEQKLQELEKKIEQIQSMMEQDINRQSNHQKYLGLKKQMSEHKSESKPLYRVYHKHGGSQINVYRKSSQLMDMVNTLKTGIDLHSYPNDLNFILYQLLDEQVELLEKKYTAAVNKSGI